MNLTPTQRLQRMRVSKMTRHNKKRNAALIYEQLVRYISRSLVEGQDEKYHIANEIIREHFKRGSQLYREFRLFNALMRTTVSDSALARRIIEEARKAAQDHNPKQLDTEKSRLIASINKRLDDKNFFNIRVPEYRSLATVQTLLNDWRLGSSTDIKRVVEYEEKVTGILMTEKTLPSLVKSKDVNALSVKLLSEKVSERFSDTLSADQLRILTLSVKGESVSLVPLLENTKRSAIDSVRTLRETVNNQTIREKLEPVEKVLRSLDPRDTSEQNVSRFLVITKLIEEAKGGEDER